MNFTKTIILALTFCLADRGTNAASLRGKAENGGDLRHLDETGVDALEPKVHDYIRHTTGGCIGKNMDGKVFTNFNTRNDLECYFLDNDGASGGYRTCRRGAAGCAQLCNEERDCVSFEYSKESDDENGTGKTCILSDTCLYDMTVKTENSSNYWYLKQPEIDGYTVHSTGGCYGENMDQHTTHHNSNAADCAALCNEYEDCFSFEFSKGEHEKYGKTCRISSTCSYDMTVHDESSNYYFYEKPAPTPSPTPSPTPAPTITLGELTGSIPTEIGLLTMLQILDLYNNELTGSIPTEIGLLTMLQILDLYINELTGSIPTEIGLLTMLDELYLDGNQLTGSIPTEIGLLTMLEYLYLDGNQLTGSIPTEIGLLTMLEHLYLDNNELTGSIPTEIGLLTMLDELNLFSNDLTGTVPPEVETLQGMGLGLLF